MIPYTKAVKRNGKEVLKKSKSVNLKKNQYAMGNEVIKVRTPRVCIFM